MLEKSAPLTSDTSLSVPKAPRYPYLNLASFDSDQHAIDRCLVAAQAQQEHLGMQICNQLGAPRFGELSRALNGPHLEIRSQNERCLSLAVRFLGAEFDNTGLYVWGSTAYFEDPAEKQRDVPFVKELIGLGQELQLSLFSHVTLPRFPPIIGTGEPSPISVGVIISSVLARAQPGAVGYHIFDPHGDDYPAYLLVESHQSLQPLHAQHSSDLAKLKYLYDNGDRLIRCVRPVVIDEREAFAGLAEDLGLLVDRSKDYVFVQGFDAERHHGLHANFNEQHRLIEIVASKTLCGLPKNA